MSKPVILFDADGFLLNFITPALRIASEVVSFDKHGVADPDYFKIEDLPTWDIFATVGREYEVACYAEYKKPGFCASLEPYPGAIEGVREAKKIADVVVVTSPLDSQVWDHERRQALLQYFNIPRRDVLFTSRKTLVKGRVLVDDRPSHVEDWVQEYPGVGIIWDQPYNRKEAIEGAWNVMRCGTWFGSGGLLEVIEQVVKTHK